jgi:hypothetical protein
MIRSKATRVLLVMIICAQLYIIFTPRAQTLNQSEPKAEKFQEPLKPVILTNGRDYARDFQRYVCENRTRVGGMNGQVAAANGDALFRVDGAWFVCMDRLVRPYPNECTILSFGISSDESFDEAMNEKYKCHVHSFDPNIETSRFAHVRSSKPELAEAVKLQVNPSWHFYKVGLVGNKSLARPKVGQIKKGDMATIEQVFELTGTTNKVIDVWKMDIEGYERPVFENLDIDYVCKYVKQFMFETHWVS